MQVRCRGTMSNKIQFHLWVCGCELTPPPLLHLHIVSNTLALPIWSGHWLKRRLCLWQSKPFVGVGLAAPRSISLWGVFCPTVNHCWLHVNYAAEPMLKWSYKWDWVYQKNNGLSCFQHFALQLSFFLLFDINILFPTYYIIITFKKKSFLPFLINRQQMFLDQW